MDLFTAGSGLGYFSFHNLASLVVLIDGRFDKLHKQWVYLHRTLAPQTSENPVYFHTIDANSTAFRKVKAAQK